MISHPSCAFCHCNLPDVDTVSCTHVLQAVLVDTPAELKGSLQKLLVTVLPLAGKDSCAIVAGASGQGEAMVANRFKGVRCSLYYGKAGTQTDMSGKQLDMISSTREHNHANCLSLGLRFLSLDEAKAVVKQFLSVPYSVEERHARRVKMIDSQN